MGHGHRNMYYLTGLPGWMRFGYSPGWGGLPPMAQYLSQTGQLPQAMSWFQQQAPALDQPITPQAQMPKDQELQMLEGQATALEDQLKQIRERVTQLRE